MKPNVLAAFLFAILFVPIVYAQEVEQAESVPAGLDDKEYQQLVETKQSLDTTRQNILSVIEKFNSDCSKVAASDADKVQSCRQQQELILAKIDSYKRDLVRYQESIQRARTHETKIIGFEKGTQGSAPAPANLGFMEPEKKPLVLSQEEKNELKDAPADIQIKMNRHYEEMRKRAKANAAWRLGFFLTEQGKYDEALQYFKEARAGFEEGSTEAMTLDGLIENPRMLPPRPLAGFPIYRNRADALLDSLEYGKGDWDVSYTYLQIAHKANPNDLSVRDALNYFEALYASEKGKPRPVSLGDIKPKQPNQ